VIEKRIKTLRVCSLFFFLDCLLSSSDESSSSGSNKSYFLSSWSESAESRGVSNVLLVSTTMRMVNRVHSNTSNHRPAPTFCFVLVVLVSCFANWFVNSASSSNNANHGSAVTWNASSASTGKSNSGPCSVVSMANDHC